MKKILLIILAIIMTSSLSSCGNSSAIYNSINMPDEYTKISVDESMIITGIETVVSENSGYKMIYNTEQNILSVENTATGAIWSSSAEEKFGDSYSKLNKTWQDNVKSLMNVTYSTLNSKNRDQTTTDSLNKINTEIIAYKIDNGLRLSITATKYKFSFCVDFTMKNGAIDIVVPVSEIREEGTAKLCELEVLPFFGAAQPTSEGFMFYPDGCGAILDFQAKKKYTGSPGAYKLSNYTLGNYVFKTTSIYYDFANQSNISPSTLPVFGIKDGTAGFVAYMIKGASDSKINIYPSGYGVDMHRISSTFVFRRSFGVYGSDISADGGANVDPLFIKVDDLSIPEDKHIRYKLLDGDNITYSTMANEYRDYLLSNDLLNDAVNDSDSAIAIDFFMGTLEDRAMNDYFVKMTSFDEVKEIVSNLNESGVYDFEINLRGWYKKGFGYYPQSPSPDKNLGGQKDLKDLAEYINENNWKMYLEVNPIDIVKENGGFSTKTDVVLDGNHFTVPYRGSSRLAYNPVSALTRYNDVYSEINKYGTGVTFERIGEYIYDDYQTTHPVYRFQTQKAWEQMLGNAHEDFGNVAVQTGNAYTLKYATRLMNIPMKDSGFPITTTSIPFYQMVVHGSLMYTGDSVNSFYNYNKQRLQLVEMGFTPNFELTYEPTYLLKNTKYNRLFSSNHELWKDEIVKIYNDFKVLSPVKNAEMISHNQISEKIYEVKYSNGYTVIVNYSNVDFDYNGTNVPAEDFSVIE